MVYQQYQTANWARGQLFAWISAWSLSVILKDWRWALFPTHNGTTDKDYLCTAVKYDVDGETVLKEEIVKVTARTGDTFTIERGAGTCPWSDTSIVQANTAFAFDADDYFYLNVTAEIIEDFQNALQWISFNWYDAIVDAGWLYDYTTVWDALADWKTNIFVNNWSYTENYRDCTSKNVRITWQSLVWVIVTFNNTDVHSACYMNLSNGTWFYMSNITFNITLTNPNIKWITSSTSFETIPFKVKNCKFTYAIANDWAWTTRYLINLRFASWVIGSSLWQTYFFRKWRNWFEDCEFYTAWDYGSTVMYLAWWCAYSTFKSCLFNTASGTWKIIFQEISNHTDCKFDCRVLCSTTSINMDWCYYVIKNGWNFSTSAASIDWNLYLWTISRTHITDFWNAVWWTTWTIYFRWSTFDNEIFFTANDFDIGFNSSNLAGFVVSWNRMIAQWDVVGVLAIYHCVNNDFAFNSFKIYGDTAWGYGRFVWNRVGSAFTIEAVNGVISWNVIDWAVTITSFGKVSFTWNNVDWWITLQASADNCVVTWNYCAAITIDATSNNNVITWNQNTSMADSGTWTIKVGNLNN